MPERTRSVKKGRNGRGKAVILDIFCRFLYCGKEKDADDGEIDGEKDGIEIALSGGVDDGCPCGDPLLCHGVDKADHGAGYCCCKACL